ncbi:MAG: hypothetical protein ABIH21_04495 [Patescibacteria group bacterium]
MAFTLPDSLAESLQSSPGKVAQGVVRERLEDLGEKFTTAAISDKKSAIRFIQSLPMSQGMIETIGHGAGHTVGELARIVLRGRGVDPSIVSFVGDTLTHTGIGGADALARVKEDPTVWHRVVNDAAIVSGATTADGVEMRAPLGYDENRIVPGVHEILVDSLNQPVLNSDGAVQLLCSWALDVSRLEGRSRPKKRTTKKARGATSTVESDVQHPHFVAVDFKEARKVVSNPVCHHCQALERASRKYEDAKSTWDEKFGVAGRRIILRAQENFIAQTGIAHLGAKEFLEAVSTVPVQLMKDFAALVESEGPLNTGPLTDAQFQRFLALIDTAGKGEKTRITKARELFGQLRDWWTGTGQSRRGIVRIFRWLAYGYIISTIVFMLLLFLCSWMLMPREWFFLGILCAGVGATGLILNLFMWGPLNSVASWITDLTPFVDEIGDSFARYGRKFIAFFCFFAIIMILLNLCMADQFLRVTAGFLIIFFAVVAIANMSVFYHLRELGEKTVAIQTAVFLLLGSGTIVLSLFLASRDVHVIPQEFPMQTLTTNLHRGVPVVEKNVTLILTPEGTFFRLEDLGDRFWHLQGTDGVACFPPNAPLPRVDGYILMRNPNWGTCKNDSAAFMMYTTPWRKIVGADPLHEFSDVNDMVRVSKLKAAVVEKEFDPQSVALGLAIFGSALLVFGFMMKGYKPIFGLVLVGLAFAMLAGSAFVHYVEPWQVTKQPASSRHTEEPALMPGALDPVDPQTFASYCEELKQKGLVSQVNAPGCPL